MLSRRAVPLVCVLAVLLANLALTGSTFAAGATATIRLDPATTQVANGATFNIKVIENGGVAVSGVSASIAFDKGILQVTSITRGSAFASAPLFVAGDAAAIANANKKGVLKAVAVSFFPPTSVAAGEQEFVTVGFKAITCGTVKMTLPIGTTKSDSTLLDGRAATYGNEIKIATTGATITVCEGGAGASAPAVVGASAAPGASDSFDPNASVDPNASQSSDPNASASAEPVPGVSVQPGASTPPTGAGLIDASSASSTSEQSGWLNFALAALAVAAAGLAALIIILTLIAIAAAVVGTVMVIRYWRRYTEKERTRTASIEPVQAGALPAGATRIAPADRGLQPDAPTSTTFPLPTAQP